MPPRRKTARGRAVAKAKKAAEEKQKVIESVAGDETAEDVQAFLGEADVAETTLDELNKAEEDILLSDDVTGQTGEPVTDITEGTAEQEDEAGALVEEEGEEPVEDQEESGGDVVEGEDEEAVDEMEADELVDEEYKAVDDENETMEGDIETVDEAMEDGNETMEKENEAMLEGNIVVVEENESLETEKVDLSQDEVKHSNNMDVQVIDDKVTTDGETKTQKTESELLTVDKTAMPADNIKMKSNAKENKNKGKQNPKKPAARKGNLPKRASDKRNRVDLGGRVLHVQPISWRHLSSPEMAPILKASIAYNVSSNHTGPDQSKVALSRKLEIWFHSTQEADEMYIKLVNFHWEVEKKNTKIKRLPNWQSVDPSLAKWDSKLSPFGLYDGRCVFASKLPDDVTMDQLKEHFPQTLNLKLPTDQSGKSMGYAIMEFESSSEAKEAAGKTVKLGETQIKLHTIGMQRPPRSKEAQEKIDRELKRIPEKQHDRDRLNSSFTSDTSRSPRQGNRNDNDRQGGGFSNIGQKRQFPTGRNDDSLMKRVRMGRRNTPGWRGNVGGVTANNREMQLQQQRMVAQQMARPLPGMMGGNMSNMRNRGPVVDEVQNIRGELLGQMERLQQGGLSDPAYLMNLAQRLQQVQGGGGGGPMYGNY